MQTWSIRHRHAEQSLSQTVAIDDSNLRTVRLALLVKPTFFGAVPSSAISVFLPEGGGAVLNSTTQYNRSKRWLVRRTL
jgi:hypothetical protein